MKPPLVPAGGADPKLLAGLDFLYLLFDLLAQDPTTKKLRPKVFLSSFVGRRRARGMKEGAGMVRGRRIVILPSSRRH